jgi:hypothetical protein
LTHSPDECKSIFVTWTWLVGIVLGVACGVGGLVYGYTQREISQDFCINKVQVEVMALKTSLNGDLDSIKILLRGIRSQGVDNVRSIR